MAAMNGSKSVGSSHEKSGLSSRLKLTIILVPVALLIVLIIAAMPGAIMRERQYRDAASLLADGDLAAAEGAFSEIPAYRDSDEMVSYEIPYLRACRIFEAAQISDVSMLEEAGIDSGEITDDMTAAMLLYQEAADRFHALGNYRDSIDLEQRCQDGIKAEKSRLEKEAHDRKQQKYDTAMELLEAGSYAEASSQFRTLSGFSNSDEMVLECLYRKAVSLYQFVSRYDVSRIYASISIEPDQTSIFSLPADEALRLGSGCVEDLRAACGQDLTDVRLEDEPDSSLPTLKEALIELFRSLGEYSDSASFPTKIDSITDYTRDFYMLCSTGDLRAAKTWLNEFQGVFPDRDRWSGLLDLYLPYCGSWVLYLGDSTLLAYSVGQSFPCMSVSSRVILTEDDVFLRLSFGESASVNFDLPSNYGEALFVNKEPETGIYMAALNNGHFVFMLYDSDWNLISSSDYIPA